jgi:hypothetical protein
MRIKSISVLKHPCADVWITIRDRLPEVIPFIEDIESVTVQSREEGTDGTVKLVNIWKANPKLPAIVTKFLKPDMLAWTDRAEYRVKKLECAWRTEPHFFTERIKCSGVTRYEPAMGGRGTRVTFDGDLELSLHNLPGVPAIFEGTLARGVETFVTALIPKNFRNLIAAVGHLLDGQTASSWVKPSPD